MEPPGPGAVPGSRPPAGPGPGPALPRQRHLTALRPDLLRLGGGGRSLGGGRRGHRDPRHRDLHPLVRQGLQLGRRPLVMGRWLVRHQPGDHIRGHGLEHRVGAELGVVGEHHHFRRRLHQRPIDAGGEHVGGGEAPFGGQPAAGEEGAGDPEPLEGLLRPAAHQRVVGAAQRPPGHDDLDPVGVGEGLCDQQGVGDDGETGHPGEPAGQLLGGGSRADDDRLALVDEARGEIGDRRLLRGGGQGLLRKAGLAGEPARQYRTAVPAVEESFGLQRPHITSYGHFGGLDDAGELTEGHGSVGPHHFKDQLATFCSEHETDSNLSGR